MNKLVSISKVCIQLNLINKKTQKPLNYILRYWEKEFKQIKPTIINKRRYYSENQIEVIKLIKYLLKDKGMRINGVKKVLKNKIKSLDDYDSFSLKTEYRKEKIKSKTKLILEKLKKLKTYGKKNSY